MSDKERLAKQLIELAVALLADVDTDSCKVPSGNFPIIDDKRTARKGSYPNPSIEYLGFQVVAAPNSLDSGNS